MAQDPYAQFTEDDKLDPTKLASLTNLISLMRDEEIEVARLKANLKVAEGRLLDLSDRQIPETMDECGLKKFETKEHLEVKVDETIRASVPVANRARAWDWLDDNGHGAMIKRTVSVAFNRDQEDDADKLLENLQDEFPNTKTEKKVEPSTLKAWIKERLEEGLPVDMELFGAFKQRRAKLKDKSK